MVVMNARRERECDFEKLRATRFKHHTQDIQRLPNYSLYQRDRGNSAHYEPQFQKLEKQIAQANQVFLQGVDEDWRWVCLQYPGLLDYYFKAVEVVYADDDGNSEQTVSLNSPVAEYRDRPRTPRAQPPRSNDLSDGDAGRLDLDSPLSNDEVLSQTLTKHFKVPSKSMGSMGSAPVTCPTISTDGTATQASQEKRLLKLALRGTT